MPFGTNTEFFKKFIKKKETPPEPEFEKIKNVIKNYKLDGLKTNISVAKELIDVIQLPKGFFNGEKLAYYRWFAECPCGESWWCSDIKGITILDQDSLRFHYLNCDKAKRNDN